jgi:hypothetical protein
MFLDGANVKRLARMIKQQAQQARFIVVSLRRQMIESAERIIGVTQARGAYTQVLGIKLSDSQEVTVEMRRLGDGEMGRREKDFSQSPITSHQSPITNYLDFLLKIVYIQTGFEIAYGTLREQDDLYNDLRTNN